LPLPDIDASLREIERALDQLMLDGVVFLTHYGDAYLGDSRLDPILEELHRRKATAFIHPTSPVCNEHTSLGFPSPIIEFMFDTTRAITNMMFSGSLDRFPDIAWIISHAGGALPVLGNRIEMMPLVAPERCDAGESVASYLRRFYYDLAGPRTDDELRAVLGIADPSRLLYGTDWPFTPDFGVTRLLDLFHETTALDQEQRAQVLSGNAVRLFPRLKP
jgi:6-methylsalicylate decarboxylase